MKAQSSAQVGAHEKQWMGASTHARVCVPTSQSIHRRSMERLFDELKQYVGFTPADGERLRAMKPSSDTIIE